MRNDTGRELYAENILAFDAQLLQDIISGRWSRQQMYDSNPGWYQDSFYDLMPPWVGRCRESPPTFENARSLPIYTPRHRYLPLGPPSDIASTTGPPSTIGPSVSENGITTTTKKVDFDMNLIVKRLLVPHHNWTYQEAMLLLFNRMKSLWLLKEELLKEYHS